MVFVLVAFMLALRARWPVLFTIVTLLCGTIPFLSFWAEFRAVRKVRAEHPELTAGAGAGA
jgi:integral membrane protein